MDLTPEIKLQTTRSGGKGGQNVNKVETAVIAFFPVVESSVLNEEQKQQVLQKLQNRVNKEGMLVVKAQIFRTQLDNREEAIRRIHELVTSALKKKKMRMPTKPSRKSREKRLDTKKRSSEIKQGRKKFRPGDI